MENPGMIKVLFVCMGNICRSPSAEFVFWNLVETHGLDPHIEVDSAGTHNYHIGGKADPRTIQAARQRGLDLNPHRARQVEITDYREYDYILAMDKQNHRMLLAECPESLRHKVQLFMAYAPHIHDEEVPDPYYGGPDGFETVLDYVEAASQGLLAEIRQNHLAHLQTP